MAFFSRLLAKQGILLLEALIKRRMLFWSIFSKTRSFSEELRSVGFFKQLYLWAYLLYPITFSIMICTWPEKYFRPKQHVSKVSETRVFYTKLWKSRVFSYPWIFQFYFRSQNLRAFLPTAACSVTISSMAELLLHQCFFEEYITLSKWELLSG